MSSNSTTSLKILSLDGGGAKGFYTLGVLKEIESLTKKPLCESFDLVYGTSTGAIIAALIALGYEVDAIFELYKKYVPVIMDSRSADSKSKALKKLADDVFKDTKFDNLKTDLAIVATRWDFETPMIFKSNIRYLHGRTGSFTPGFGCKIGDAITASCAAYPFFNKVTVQTADGTSVLLIDGGYCANNPTLYAIADAVKVSTDIKVVTIGVGIYPEPHRWKSWFFNRFLSVQLLQKTLNVNTASMEQLRKVLFPHIPTIRINDEYSKPDMATDLLESDIKKLEMLFQRGRESFSAHEQDLKALFI